MATLGKRQQSARPALLFNTEDDDDTKKGTDVACHNIPNNSDATDSFFELYPSTSLTNRFRNCFCSIRVDDSTPPRINWK